MGNKFQNTHVEKQWGQFVIHVGLYAWFLRFVAFSLFIKYAHFRNTTVAF